MATLIGTAHDDSLAGNEGHDELSGLAGNDRLSGLAGNDRLDGGSGADRMLGGAGADEYHVDNVGDRVVEAAGGGTDQVYSAIDYALPLYVEDLVLLGSAVSGRGNGLDNAIAGTAGANRLDGKAGVDTLSGLAGDDLYFVDNPLDRVIEAAGGGNDRIVTRASYSLAIGEEIERISALTPTATTAIVLGGNEIRNVLTANNGSNTLDGGAGADVMIGLGGADKYRIDNAGDRIVEASGAGDDDAYTSVSYVLGAGVAVDTLLALDPAALTPLSLTGNELSNELMGNAGNNVLDGKAGRDDMRGLRGNDTYIVDHVRDLAWESGNTGDDRVLASVDYRLARGAAIENLATTDSSGSDPIDLTGNDRVNTVTGNAGNNKLDGGENVDTLAGLAGDDEYVVDRAGDVVVERAGHGNDRLYALGDYALRAGVHVETVYASRNFTGNELDNRIVGDSSGNHLHGGAGDDRIEGDGGQDWLFGGAGNDTIVLGEGNDAVFFDTALSASSNVDRLMDFGYDDIIYLDRTIFKGIREYGGLDREAFQVGSVAKEADDRILFNEVSGKIFYDADGTGAAPAVLFAQVGQGAEIYYGSFYAPVGI